MTVRYGHVVFPMTFNDDDTEGAFDELNFGCVVLSDVVIWEVVDVDISGGVLMLECLCVSESVGFTVNTSVLIWVETSAEDGIILEGKLFDDIDSVLDVISSDVVCFIVDG